MRPPQNNSVDTAGSAFLAWQSVDSSTRIPRFLTCDWARPTENFSAPGTFYYDKAQGSILYVPRAGESVATLEATATTATAEELVVANHTKNLRWENVHFQYATSLHASGPQGFVDTQVQMCCAPLAEHVACVLQTGCANRMFVALPSQSGYLYQDGEPLTNIHVQASQNVSFLNCGFSHLGAVYALGADQGSQNVVISNCSFDDCSGGAIKLGSSGERGAPSPSVTLDPSLQDRGFLVSDCLMTHIPVEYGSANPIFGGYVADTLLTHNTIANSAYSVCPSPPPWVRLSSQISGTRSRARLSCLRRPNTGIRFPTRVCESRMARAEHRLSPLALSLWSSVPQAICLGWGWGMSSYMRNVHALNVTGAPLAFRPPGSNVFPCAVICSGNHPPLVWDRGKAGEDRGWLRERVRQGLQILTPIRRFCRCCDVSRVLCSDP